MLKKRLENVFLFFCIDAMIDKLLMKGKDQYEKFLSIIGKKYPKVYKKITGIEPPGILASHDLTLSSSLHVIT